MLLKYEFKDPNKERVKSISFHPVRPWVLASFHDGSIKLIDYEMETLIETFREHRGPVRGVAFHPTQPLFVSGGDDFKIKVWNYEKKRCLFTLSEHSDYIRTVQFHHEYPWILSASDDQTVRIWNWQSRDCISILSGHNHYAMCAQFHPKKDLVLSASLDVTIRVWDISGLRKKNVSIQHETDNNSNEFFGGNNVVLKYTLEGHTRGINWASFHPTAPLIVSGADDREIKIWKMNEQSAFVVDTLTGHMQNVSCVLFHPKLDFIISNSEDRTIRTWNVHQFSELNKGSKIINRSNERWWILEAHPNKNLIGAGNDEGFIIFKLFRERPPNFSTGKHVYYWKDGYIRQFDFKANKDKPILATKTNQNKHPAPPTDLIYNISNTQQHCVLLCSDDQTFDLYITKKKGNNSHEMSKMITGIQGRSAVFFARNRFVILTQKRELEIRDLENKKKLKIDVKYIGFFVNHLFSAGKGKVLLRTPKRIVLYNIHTQQVVSELFTQGRYRIKYVVWSEDRKFVALYSKKNLYLCTSDLKELCNLTETTRIKSGTWDGEVFIYSTATHLKYVLPNRDTGILRSLPDPIYITNCSSKKVHFLNREVNNSSYEIDPTEYKFKYYLMKKKYTEALKIVDSKKLVGKAIISYLQKKNFPKVALQFVEDPKIKFALALECGDVKTAEECCDKLQNQQSWHRLGVEALRQGNCQVVDYAYQKTSNLERLSFLYTITGQTEKLEKMMEIANYKKDLQSRFHNALYLGDVQERIQALIDSQQFHLAYISAKTHGLDDAADQIAQLLGDSEKVANFKVNPKAKLLTPPLPIMKQKNWPLVELEKSTIELLIDKETSDSDKEENSDDGEVKATDKWGVGDDDDKEDDGDDEVKVAGDDILGDLGDFGDEEEDEEELKDDGAYFKMPTEGENVTEKWQRSSTLACDAIASGSFDTAMRILEKQIGCVNFKPLFPYFKVIRNSAFLQLSMCSSLISVPIERASEQKDSELPFIGLSLKQCTTGMKQSLKLVGEFAYQQAVDSFRKILHMLPLIPCPRVDMQKKAVMYTQACREYLTSLRSEIARNEFEDKVKKGTATPEDKVRRAELASLNTLCKLQPADLVRQLKIAVKTCWEIGNFKTASQHCHRILDLCISSKKTILQDKELKRIRGIKKKADQKNTNKFDIDFSENSDAPICCETLKQIKTEKAYKCRFCSSYFTQEVSPCKTCLLSKVVKVNI